MRRRAGSSPSLGSRKTSPSEWGSLSCAPTFPETPPSPPLRARALTSLKGSAGDAGLTVADFPQLAAAPSSAGAAAGSPNKRKREVGVSTYAVPVELQALLGAALAKQRASQLVDAEAGGASGGGGQQKRGRPPNTPASLVCSLPIAFRLTDAFPPAAAKPPLPPAPRGSLASLGGGAAQLATAAPLPPAPRDACAAALRRWRLRAAAAPSLDAAAALDAELAARQVVYPVEDAALPLEPPLPSPPQQPPPPSLGGGEAFGDLTPEELGQVLQVRRALRSGGSARTSARARAPLLWQVWDFVRVFASGEDALECSPEWCGDQLVASTSGRWASLWMEVARLARRTTLGTVTAAVTLSQRSRGRRGRGRPAGAARGCSWRR